MAKSKSKNATFSITILFSCLITILISVIGLFRFGDVGNFINNLVGLLLGQFQIFYFILFILLSIIIIFKRQLLIFNKFQIIGGIILFLSFISLLAWIYSPNVSGFTSFSRYFDNIYSILFKNANSYGGLLGQALFALFSSLLDYWGSLFLILFLILIGVLLCFYHYAKEYVQKPPRDINFDLSPSKVLNKVRPPKIDFNKLTLKRSDKDVSVQNEKPKIKLLKHDDTSDDLVKVDDNQPQFASNMGASVLEQDVTFETVSKVKNVNDSSKYILPSINLLDKAVKNRISNANEAAASDRGKKLVDILDRFGVPTTLLSTHIGPAVTKFELRLDSNIKVSRFNSLADNIMMELAVKDLRIEAPIPGRNAVGVEIPNVEMIPVRMYDLAKNVDEKYTNSQLLMMLGKDLMGKPVYGEINKMPHLLIAGATGSGKSVCVNGIITSLVMNTNPADVKLLLIDPKKVEFAIFNDIPHLIAPVISDALEASRSLNIVVNIMQERYSAFQMVGARNIAGYNEKAVINNLNKMPYIVVIIDELADLMMVANKEVEASIQRITQLARAAGIHLIVATQRPSVDVITGVIKANIPSRIAFAVSSGTDSRTILDVTGAERLLGYGDMLYQPIGEPHPIRIQGVFVADDEVSRVVEFAKKQMKPVYDEQFFNLSNEGSADGFVDITDDPLFEEAKQFVIDCQKASTSLLQRRFSVGYNRAARMIDQLEAMGVIGPAQGSKPRDVYIKND